MVEEMDQPLARPPRRLLPLLRLLVALLLLQFSSQLRAAAHARDLCGIPHGSSADSSLHPLLAPLRVRPALVSPPRTLAPPLGAQLRLPHYERVRSYARLGLALSTTQRRDALPSQLCSGPARAHARALLARNRSSFTGSFQDGEDELELLGPAVNSSTTCSSCSLAAEPLSRLQQPVQALALQSAALECDLPCR